MSILAVETPSVVSSWRNEGGCTFVQTPNLDFSLSADYTDLPKSPRSKLIGTQSMQRERVTDNIYVFTSDLYAQVTAGLIVTDEGSVLIDTLAYPEETRQIKQFAEDRLKTEIRYVVNTHYHADHTTGTCFFPNAQVIAHQLCRELLDRRGRESLEGARANSTEMREVTLVRPDIVFDRSFTLHLGDKALQCWSTPGHSMDSIVCLVKEDQVLFAADTMMPVPYFVDGDYDAFLTSLTGLKQHHFENIIQGHGEVILRGEVDEEIQRNIDYLVRLREAVDSALASHSPQVALDAIDIEDCGKSRILLNGAVQILHRQNVQSLALKRRVALRLEYPNS
jgi:cyclase